MNKDRDYQEKMEALVSLSLDEPLCPEDEQLLEQALAGSPDLRRLAQDLALIKGIAATPVPEAPPASPQLCNALPQPRGKHRIPLFASGILAAAAAILLFLMVPLQEDPSTPNMSKIVQAQYQSSLYFHERLNGMELLVAEHLMNMDTETASYLTKHINRINRTLAYCERTLSQNPSTPQDQQALADVYQSKVDLLNTILAS